MSWSIAVSGDMSTLMKQLTANRTSPRPTSRRRSTLRISNGMSGSRKSCGMPLHITTSPICWAL